MTAIVVAALYKFVRLPDFETLRAPLHDLMTDNEVRGTLLLALEGINGTIAGPRAGVDTVLAWLRSDPRLQALETKESYVDENPFYRTKVKLKKEIVTMGVEDIDPNHIVGTYVKAAEWNALISDPDVVLVDTRNDYEVKIGTFRNALNPQTESFREFPAFAKEHLDPQKHRKVAMFCTGGIRCEKSTAFMKQQGFTEVYHLEGGILKYLEEVPEEESLWEGECFVFDNRVTVNHQLERGQYEQCHACRMPITAQDMASPYYERGISCPHCHDSHDAEQLRRYAERERQVQLAKARGEPHIGESMAQTIARRRHEKHLAREEQRRRNEAAALRS